MDETNNTPISKAVFAAILNPALGSARHQAVAEELPRLLSTFGLSFTGRCYQRTDGEQELITPIYGHFTPLEGDPDVQTPDQFAGAVSSFVQAVNETGMSHLLFKSMAILACTKEEEPDLKEVVICLTKQTMRMIAFEAQEMEDGG